MFDIGDGWRRVARYAAIAWLVWAVVLTIAIGGLEPFILIFAFVPIAFWGLTLWKPGKVTYTLFGVIGLLVILLNFPFLIEDLVHPESAFGFNTTTWPVLTAVMMILVGVAAWRTMSERVASRTFMVAAVVFGVGLVISVIAAFSLKDDVLQAGDTVVTAHEAEWSTDAISLTSGDAVFVENQDPVRHTFTIDDLDLSVELPANTDRRIEISAPPGAYAYHCTVPGHEDMKGTITVG